MPPLFITFEGLDGSGKSTHLRRASEWLTRRGIPHLVTHEPGGTPLGDALRAVFLDHRWGAVDGVVELLLVFASRRQHLIEVIEPALAAGRHVLCDRFTDSTRAYQGYGRGVPLDVIDQVDRLATGGRRPDHTLLFDLPAAAARARGHSPARQGRGEADRLDAETFAFYERVREGFLAMSREEPRFRVVDSAGAVKATEERLGRLLGELFPALEGGVNLPAALDAARRGHLYPAVILDGGDAAARRSAALELARTLLCDQPPDGRPCGVCRHCRRIVWPGGDGDGGGFHPDFQVLERDLKASTSVDATREMLRTAQVSPFEARGQVFVVASAESLTGEAANALLKSLEEPHTSAPRHFFLLAPSRLDLLRTLRSRSLAVFLGPAEPIDPGTVEPMSRAFAAAAAAWTASGSPVYLLSAAAALLPAGGWEDPRSGRPWAVAAAAVLGSLAGEEDAAARRARLALAESLLEGPGMRLRGIAAERILEGLVARHLAL